MTDIVCLGELLVDFAPQGTDENGWPRLQALPGGAPANVAAAAAKYGLKAGFIGAVGDDQFGRLLTGALDKAGIDTRGVMVCEDAFTTLAFVMLDEKGDRDFSFARKPGADTRLVLDDTKTMLIQNARCLHFGTLSLGHEPAAEATREAVGLATEAGVWVSFDPNYRAPLWDSHQKAREAMRWGLAHCDSIKAGLDELKFMFGTHDLEEALNRLFSYERWRFALITDGLNGSRFYSRSLEFRQPALRQANTIDTTGAGDIFTGTVLAKLLLEKGSVAETVGRLELRDWSAIIREAAAAAALSTTRHGGITSIPEPSEAEALARASAADVKM